MPASFIASYCGWKAAASVPVPAMKSGWVSIACWTAEPKSVAGALSDVNSHPSAVTALLQVVAQDDARRVGAHDEGDLLRVRRLRERLGLDDLGRHLRELSNDSGRVAATRRWSGRPALSPQTSPRSSLRVPGRVVPSGVDSSLLSLSSSPPHAATSIPAAMIAAAANRFPRTGVSGASFPRGLVRLGSGSCPRGASTAPHAVHSARIGAAPTSGRPCRTSVLHRIPS